MPREALRAPHPRSDSSMFAQTEMHAGIAGGQIAACRLHAALTAFGTDRPGHKCAVGIAAQFRDDPKVHPVAALGDAVRERVGRPSLLTTSRSIPPSSSTSPVATPRLV